ncbi:MAG TPA: hypothetical protein VL727_19205 [Puia sp.]|jgi:hypothetical protein|nr:hypothetical protein [Puia sp.]
MQCIEYNSVKLLEQLGHHVPGYNAAKLPDAPPVTAGRKQHEYHRDEDNGVELDRQVGPQIAVAEGLRIMPVPYAGNACQ